MYRQRTKWIGFTLFFAVVVLGTVFYNGNLRPQKEVAQAGTVPQRDYIVMAWNDLGMHCYNRDFQDLAVLPPYNTLWAQVIKVGDPPQLVSSGITVTYAFPDNTYSVGKSNFWDYDQQLFGVDLPPDVGLAGYGLAGDMAFHDDHFVAEGIPLTEFLDSNLTNPYPYQLAEITVLDQNTGDVLAHTTAVAPVSTEMNCDDCHFDGGVEGVATGRIETNILTLHDTQNMDEYPSSLPGALMDRRPVLCAECHASNALGTAGFPNIPSLSNAMHQKHEGEVPDTQEGCYKCHPGPNTLCLRDVMSDEHNMDCLDCHSSMDAVSKNPEPWLNEPRCDNAACHGSAYQQDQALYRLSKGHGDLYCAACHDSPHAIAPSREVNDGIKFIELQGYNNTLEVCTVCHLTEPDGGIHGIPSTPAGRLFLPFVNKDE
ncbi:MAG: hypothetical protein H6654_12375 [Ardenticatenaceae bacterium]|nr:hypothetical protein [Anaerolineales bacterium]MCB8937777.1 hypothetical protein [Ardenticatenaceae bacterium]MCB8974346.1 hypothetical protein [Ardenticatenaceae bacterium]